MKNLWGVYDNGKFKILNFMIDDIGNIERRLCFSSFDVLSDLGNYLGIFVIGLSSEMAMMVAATKTQEKS